MIIGDRERDLLAELRDMPSFVLLVKIMKEYEDDVLSEVTLCKKDDELIRATRFYQVLRAVREFMESRPQAAYDEIERVRKTFFTDQETGVEADAFRNRYDPGVLESGDVLGA